MLLEALGFDSHEVGIVRGQYLEAIVTSYIAGLKARLLRGSDGERLAEIIVRRFALDGASPEILRQLGDRLGVTRERRNSHVLIAPGDAGR